MKLLDLFCGVGGASVGYHRAGFEDIVGIDIAPQPNYPYPFIQADALAPPVDLDAFDLIHASPPCQAYSVATPDPGQHPALVEPVRALLAGHASVIENVIGAPLHDPYVLCGSMFGLKAYDPARLNDVYLRRHRAFETSFPMLLPPDRCRAYRGFIAGVYGGGSEDRIKASRNRNKVGRPSGGYTPNVDVRRGLMGMPWATRAELNEAIPPAYTEFVGGFVTGR